MTTNSTDAIHNCCTLFHGTTNTGDRSPSAVDDCCTPTSSTANATALDELRSQETPADVAAIRNAAFTLLLETGQPVAVGDLVAATDIAPDRVAEIFDSVHARGRVEFDDDGHLIGIAGLSLTPSRHQLTIGDDTRWTWCALDAVGILGALRATGTVKSTDPQTGDTIEIEFVDGSPDTNTHLFILEGYTKGSIREDWCPRVNFFTTREAARAWVDANDLEGDIVPVANIASDAAEMWRPVVDVEAPQVC